MQLKGLQHHNIITILLLCLYFRKKPLSVEAFYSFYRHVITQFLLKRVSSFFFDITNIFYVRYQIVTKGFWRNLVFEISYPANFEDKQWSQTWTNNWNTADDGASYKSVNIPLQHCLRSLHTSTGREWMGKRALKSQNPYIRKTIQSVVKLSSDSFNPCTAERVLKGIFHGEGVTAF